MEDIIRWILLGLIFAGLLGAWLWSRRFAAGQGTLGGVINGSLKVLQKRWVDQRTGVALVEAENQFFLLAYTVGGGVSWHPVDKTANGTKLSPAAPASTSLSVDSKR